MIGYILLGIGGWLLGAGITLRLWLTFRECRVLSHYNEPRVMIETWWARYSSYGHNAEVNLGEAKTLVFFCWIPLAIIIGLFEFGRFFSFGVSRIFNFVLPEKIRRERLK